MKLCSNFSQSSFKALIANSFTRPVSFATAVRSYSLKRSRLLPIATLFLSIVAVAMLVSGGVSAGRNDAATSTSELSLNRSHKPGGGQTATHALNNAPLLPPPPTNRYVDG